MRIFKGTSEVTGHCYLDFRHAELDSHTTVSLDDSGWVFLSLLPGRTLLASLSCAVWNGLSYGAFLPFEVASNAPTYFGDVRFDLRDNDASITGAIAVGVLTGTGGMAWQPPAERMQPVTVQDRSDEARQEYEKRYGKLDELSYSLAGEPAEAKPVVQRQDEVVSVDTRLNGATLRFIGLARDDNQRLAWRLQRSGQTYRLRGCTQAELSVDGNVTHVALSYKVVRAAEGFREIVQADTDADTLRSIAAAKEVTFSLCGYRQKLTPRGSEAAKKLLGVWDSMVAELPKANAADVEAATQPQATPAEGHER